MTFRQQIKRVLRRAVRTSRIAFYRGLSDNTYASRDVELVQPMLYTGKGFIRFTGCPIGTQPSPRLWDGYVHMDARGATVAIDIAPNVLLNNSGGRNSVIAAGSVVDRSLPANSIAGGAPARVLGPVPGAPH